MNKLFNAEDILPALGRVLKSRTFERSERARELLKYLVQQDLDGKGDTIKGFSIAVDVFGKDAQFDSATDPLVRVHAGRLRELLSAYYSEEGKNEQIVISVPTGRYVPIYTAGKTAGEIIETENNTHSNVEIAAPSETRVSSKPSLFPGISPLKVIGILFAILFLGLTALLLIEIPKVWHRLTIDSQDSAQDIQASASQLPVIQVITDVDDEDLVTFADQLTSRLSAFDTITTLQTRPLSVLERRRGQWGDLEYGLKVTKTGNNSPSGYPIVSVELLSLAQDQIMRAEEYPKDIWDQAGSNRVVAQKLTGMATPEGVIYADIMTKGDVNPVMNCFGKIRIYYGLSNSDTHKEAYDCTKTLSSVEGASGLIIAIHGGLIAEAAGKSYVYSDLPKDKDEAKRIGLNTALKGVDIDPLSARAAREVGFVYSWQGAFGAMSEWFARANDLNPNDTSVAASYGYGLVLSSAYKQAIPIFDDAIKSTSRHPSWWDFYYALALLMENRFEEASAAIIPMGLSKRSLLYSALNAVLAYRMGNRSRATFLVRQLREAYPKFAADPAGSFRNRHFPPELIDNLVEALENSGLNSVR